MFKKTTRRRQNRTKENMVIVTILSFNSHLLILNYYIKCQLKEDLFELHFHSSFLESSSLLDNFYIYSLFFIILFYLSFTNYIGESLLYSIRIFKKVFFSLQFLCQNTLSRIKKLLIHISISKEYHSSIL